MEQIALVYENIPIGMMSGSTTVADHKQSFVDMTDFKTIRNVPKYATLEQGRNILDGTFINFPSNPQGFGYLSTIMTDENCEFEENITITRTYADKYSSPRINNSI